MFRSRIYTSLTLGQAVEGSGNNINRYHTINEYKTEDGCMDMIGSDGWDTEGPTEDPTGG